jgi:hypothetical protein
MHDVMCEKCWSPMYNDVHWTKSGENSYEHSIMIVDGSPWWISFKNVDNLSQ